MSINGRDGGGCTSDESTTSDTCCGRGGGSRVSERSSLVPEAPGGGGNCSDDGTIKAAADVAAGLPCSWRSAVKRSRMIATDATKVDVTSTARTTNDWQPHGTVPCVVRAELRSSLCSTTLYVRRILWSTHSSCNNMSSAGFCAPAVLWSSASGFRCDFTEPTRNGRFVVDTDHVHTALNRTPHDVLCL